MLPKKKDPRGRPNGIPNKICDTCKYFEQSGAMNADGFVHFALCTLNNRITNSKAKCKNYVLCPENIRKKKLSLWKVVIEILIRYKILGYRLYWRKIEKKG